MSGGGGLISDGAVIEWLGLGANRSVVKQRGDLLTERLMSEGGGLISD